MDECAAAAPGSFSGFEGRPTSWMAKLREFREKLAHLKGDARKGRMDTTWLVNDYNTMISTSQLASRVGQWCLSLLGRFMIRPQLHSVD